ncbi:MAG: VacB/RNase II family 3'-5' exoribonuclease [Actinobacteria bacterium]|nr:VacB/RNase II family 3'-5' exoribonuclease [Actinomycetota bacterium]
MVALITKHGKIYRADPLFGDQKEIFVGHKALNGARPGELVVLKPDGRGRGQVTRRLGKAGSQKVLMEGVLTYYQVPRGFSPAVLEEAEAQTALAGQADGSRRDLTELLSFTIDPDEARDYDDAISVVDGPGPGEITLYVHIADVSYFVPAGSAIDKAAARKSVSVYLPVAVEPMLPQLLSNDICSLRPGEDRKCVTVEMVYEWNAAVEEAPDAAAKMVPRKVRFYRSLIRSSRRLTYNEVDDFFEGKPGGATEKLEDKLEQCRRFSASLRDARHARGALAIHTYEPEFRLDESGNVIGVRPRPQSESHALIEEFMIAANEAVARFLEQKQGNCIYRVHEEPDAAAVESLFDLLDDMGIPVPVFSLAKGSPQQAGRAIRDLLRSLPRVLSEQQRDRSVFGEIVLRSLKQARYLEDNLGHFGLASEAYLHFTSPIRRYPDLVVHRALLRELHIEDFSCDRLELAEVALQSSENERRAALAERTGDDIVLAFLLDRLLYEEGWDTLFEGEVVSLIPSGLFVRFEDCYEGYVPARSLRGDFYVLSDKGSALVGRRSGRPYRLGDRMTVRVVRIDKLRGKVELEPARG